MRWIVFDAMGVVFPEPDDISGLLVPFLRARRKDFAEASVDAPYREASLGRISPAEFWARIGFGAEYPAIEREYLDTRLRPDPGFIPLADELGRRYRLGLLSNDVGAWSKRLRESHDLERRFSCVLISGDAGFRKPDPRIFEAFLAKSGARAGECAFIDDRLRNLAAAKAVGMATVHFDTSLPDESGYVPDAVAQGFAGLPAALAALGW
jgi:HAD superfamily hydrolase (TIGR01509 family)